MVRKRLRGGAAMPLADYGHMKPQAALRSVSAVCECAQCGEVLVPGDHAIELDGRLFCRGVCGEEYSLDVSYSTGQGVMP